MNKQLNPLIIISITLISIVLTVNDQIEKPENVLQLGLGNFTKTTDIPSPPKQLSLHKEWFILFYSKSCPHCRQTLPIFHQIAKEPFKFQLNIGQLQCPSNPKICHQFSITGYPTLIYFKDRQMFQFPAQEYRTVQNFILFIKKSHQGNQKKLNLEQKTTLFVRFVIFVETLTSTGLIIFVSSIALFFGLIGYLMIDYIRNRYNKTDMPIDPQSEYLGSQSSKQEQKNEKK